MDSLPFGSIDPVLGSSDIRAVFYSSKHGAETITCSFDLYGEAGGQLKLARLGCTTQVDVQVPDSFLVISSAFPQSVISGDRLFSSTTGTRIRFNVVTPPEFVQGADTGMVAVCQLVKDDRDHSPGTDDDYGTGIFFWLDNTFPYLDSEHIARVQGLNDPTAATTPFKTSDHPNDFLEPTYTGVTINNLYRTSTIYRPPGADSEYVPLKTRDWKWNVSVSKVGGVWPPVPGGGVSFPAAETLEDVRKATWTRAYLNSDPPHKTP